jgi:polysaccharide biosynthesis/export protein
MGASDGHSFWVGWVVLTACLATSGCATIGASPLASRTVSGSSGEGAEATPFKGEVQGVAMLEVAHENNKILINDYIINPPDVLVIDLVRAVPLPPYKIRPQDLLFVTVKGTPPDDPIKGVFRVEPEGVIRLGPNYGSLPIADLTLDEAIQQIEKHLKEFAELKKPQVSVSLEESRGTQIIRGEHLVRPDGAVNLGIYGRVIVGGMTQERAKAAIEEHLSKFFLKPSVSVDIGGFNSSVYYIIFDGGGSGQQIIRISHTGSETVLDAVAQVFGLPAVASKCRVWLARPDGNTSVILPIDWKAITKDGRTATNYQLFPGDRIYVGAHPLTTVDTVLGRILAPVERILGVTLLGASAYSGIAFPQNNGGGGR